MVFLFSFGQFSGVVLLSIVFSVIFGPASILAVEPVQADKLHFRLAEYPPIPELDGIPMGYEESGVLWAEIFECYRKSAVHPVYQEAGYSLRHFYGCDLEPLWEEVNQKNTEMTWLAAHEQRKGPKSHRRLRSSVEGGVAFLRAKSEESEPQVVWAASQGTFDGMREDNVKACQLAHHAHTCMAAERVVECLRSEVLPPIAWLRLEAINALVSYEAVNETVMMAAATSYREALTPKMQRMQQVLSYICEILMDSGCSKRATELGIGMETPFFWNAESCALGVT